MSFDLIVGADVIAESLSFTGREIERRKCAMQLSLGVIGIAKRRSGTAEVMAGPIDAAVMEDAHARRMRV